MSTLAIKSQLKSTTCGFIAHWQIGVFASVTFTSYQRYSIILKQWPDLVFTIWLLINNWKRFLKSTLYYIHDYINGPFDAKYHLHKDIFLAFTKTLLISKQLFSLARNNPRDSCQDLRIKWISACEAKLPDSLIHMRQSLRKSVQMTQKKGLDWTVIDQEFYLFPN